MVRVLCYEHNNVSSSLTHVLYKSLTYRDML